MRNALRPVLSLAVVGLLAAVPASQAFGGAAKRSSFRSYVAPGSASGTPVVIIGPDNERSVGGVVFGVKRHERFVNVAIQDSNMTGKVAGEVAIDQDGDGKNEVFKFCGATSKRIRTGKAKGFGVFLIANPCGDEPATATEGRVKAVFTK